MSEPNSITRSFVTCQVESLEIGIDLESVREILRSTSSTRVCGARHGVDGLVNLRGELVTVLDLAAILHGSDTEGRESREPTEKSRTIIIESHEESIGLTVDRVGDVFVCDQKEVEPVPGNLQHGAADRFFEGVVQNDDHVYVILDLATTLDPQESLPAGASAAAVSAS